MSMGIELLLKSKATLLNKMFIHLYYINVFKRQIIIGSNILTLRIEKYQLILQFNKHNNKLMLFMNSINLETAQ